MNLEGPTQRDTTICRQRDRDEKASSKIEEEDRLFIMNLEGTSLSKKIIWERLPHCRLKSTAMLGYVRSDTNNTTIGSMLKGTRIGDVY